MNTEPNNRLEGVTYIYDKHGGAPVGKFYGTDGTFYWGGQGLSGRVRVQDAQDHTLFEFDAELNRLVVRNRQGDITFCVDGETGEIFANMVKPLAVAVMA